MAGLLEATARGAKPIVFYGAGSLALLLHDFLDAAGYRLLAILSDFEPTRPLPLAVPIIVGQPAIERWLETERSSHLGYAIAIGNRHRARLERFRFLRERGLKPTTLKHPTSFVSPSARLGLACQALAFSFVGTSASLGNAVILNTRASVDHECRLGDAVYIGPGA